MNKIIMTVVSLLTFEAHAGLELKLEHPRYPSKVEDKYLITCKTECDLEILSNESLKGTSTSPQFETKIKELMNLHIQGFLPKEPEDDSRILYKIAARDGSKKFDLVVGYPMSYEGREYTKFTQLISVIEEIKRSMKSELREKK